MKRMNSALVFGGLLILGVTSTAPAQAQEMICGKRQSIVKQLQAKYGETARVMGFSQGAGVVEVYANDESGSWTILVTNPSGTSCLMAAGEAFEAVDIKLGDAPA